MVWRVIVGALLVLIGLVWIGQGLGWISGSAMSGHIQYTFLGLVVGAVGVVLIVWATRLRAASHHPAA
jgi:hypothetical protein